MRHLIALIILTIVVQNTCPYGYAAKTAITAPAVHHCPLMDRDHTDNDHADNDAGKKMTKDPRDIHQLFVIAAAPALKIIGAFDTITEPGAPGRAVFEDIFADPPLRPPKC